MIYGARVRLRRPERSDLPLFVSWLNDPEVRAGISMVLPMGLAEEEKWFEGLLERSPYERLLTVDMQDGEGGWQTIGNTNLFDFDWRCRSAEFGIMLGERSVWGQGYGTEVTRLMQDHAFGTLNLNRLFLRVYAYNQRAVRVYEKAGYRLEGTLREAAFKDGEYVDVHLMGILRSEWEALRKESNAGAP